MIERIFTNIQADEDRPEPVAEVLQNVYVLFADKDQQTLDIFKKTVDYLGWKGDYVTNVTDILKAINDNASNYDAIVSGVNFFSDNGPRLTGITAARQIRKIRPNIPIVFVTSYVTSIVREEVRRVNAELLPKPVDVIELFTRVSQLVYWNRLTTIEAYDGPDRRKMSVNFGLERRRSTDRLIEIPKILSQSLENVITDQYHRSR